MVTVGNCCVKKLTSKPKHSVLSDTSEILDPYEQSRNFTILHVLTSKSVQAVEYKASVALHLFCSANVTSWLLKPAENLFLQGVKRGLLSLPQHRSRSLVQWHPPIPTPILHTSSLVKCHSSSTLWLIRTVTGWHLAVLSQPSSPACTQTPISLDTYRFLLCYSAVLSDSKQDKHVQKSDSDKSNSHWQLWELKHSYIHGLYGMETWNHLPQAAA